PLPCLRRNQSKRDRRRHKEQEEISKRVKNHLTPIVANNRGARPAHASVRASNCPGSSRHNEWGENRRPPVGRPYSAFRATVPTPLPQNCLFFKGFRLNFGLSEWEE